MNIDPLTITGFMSAGTLFAIFRAGVVVGNYKKAQDELDKKLAALDRLNEKLDALPALVAKVGQIEEVVRRHTSDIKDLLKAAGESQGYRKAARSGQFTEE